MIDEQEIRKVLNKKTIFLNLFFSIGLSILTIYFLGKFFIEGLVGFDVQIFSIHFLFLLFLLSISDILIQSIRFQALLLIFNVRLSFFSSLNLIVMGEFFSRLTPIKSGGGEIVQTFILYRDHNASVPDVLFMLTIKAIVSGTAQVLIFLAAYIFILFFNPAFSLHKGISIFKEVLYFGITVYFLLYIIGILFLIFADKLSNFLNFLKEKSYFKAILSKEKAKKIFGKVYLFLNNFKESKKKLKETKKTIILKIVFCSIIFWLVLSFIPLAILDSLKLPYSFSEVFFKSLVYYVGTAFLPTPGSSGGAEIEIFILFENIVPKILLTTFIFAWRFFDHYIKLILGFIFSLVYFYKKPVSFK